MFTLLFQPLIMILVMIIIAIIIITAATISHNGNTSTKTYNS